MEIPFFTTVFLINCPTHTRKRKSGIPVHRILNGTGSYVFTVITVKTPIKDASPHFQSYFSRCCLVPYRYFIKYMPNSTSGTLSRKKN